MKFKKTLMACALALFSTLTVGHVQAASNSVQDVIDETYVQPDYVLGYSLSDDQRNQTLSLLGYDSSKDTNVKTITTSLMLKLWMSLMIQVCNYTHQLKFKNWALQRH